MPFVNVPPADGFSPLSAVISTQAPLILPFEKDLIARCGGAQAVRVWLDADSTKVKTV